MRQAVATEEKKSRARKGAGPRANARGSADRCACPEGFLRGCVLGRIGRTVISRMGGHGGPPLRIAVVQRRPSKRWREGQAKGTGRIAAGTFILVCSFHLAWAGDLHSQPVFVDVTQQAGITWKHFSGGSEDRFLIETMGAGVGFLDFDNDGLLDIYLVNGGETPKGKSEELFATLCTGM